MVKEDRDVKPVTADMQVREDRPLPAYPLSCLRQICLKVFGVTTSTFDGATYGLDGVYTIAELKAHIEKWQKKSVLPKKKEVR